MSTADTFHAAARRGDFAECKRLLGLDKELVHSRDGGGRTLLHHWAALDPSCEQASCAALTWARTYEVELDAVNDKTGTWWRCVCRSHPACGAHPWRFTQA
jgi:hypothetical protein